MKLRNSAGESLMESLVSILILTFASILLLTLVTASRKINQSAKEMDQALFRQLLEVELAPETQKTRGTVTVTVNGDSQTLPVEVYGGDGLIAWYPEDGQ